MLKRAYIGADLVDASIVEGLLKANGISAVLKGEYAWIARGETPLTEDTAPAVWVPAPDLESARRLIEARENRRHLPLKQCPACGEDLEGQFTQCWKCGAALDEDSD